MTDSTQPHSIHEAEAGKEVVTGSATYEGETLEGCKHGVGTLTWDDGDKFEGVFVSDEKVRGTFTWKAGDKYTGEWKHSLMHGKGTYHYRNGRKYEGDWVAGYKQGVGTFTWPNGDSYKGQFHLDKCNGIGQQTFADGRVYIGEWLNNKKHGFGVMMLPTNEKIEGCWKANLLSGLSIYTCADGTRWEEKWRAGTHEGSRLRLKRTESEMRDLLNTTTPPVWSPDSDHKECYKCSAPFTVMNRRHHCRHCGLVFCNNCTTQRLELAHYRSESERMSRVCDECSIAYQTHSVLQKATFLTRPQPAQTATPTSS